MTRSKIRPNALDPDVPSWEIQPNESPGVYAQFLQYRDMEKRSIRSVDGTASDEAAIRWSWTKRALDWDRHVARQEADELIRARIAMNQRHRAVARAAQAKIQTWLLQIDPTKLKPTEAARWWELAVRVEREASGANLPDAALPPPEPPTADPLEGITMGELLGVDEEDVRGTLRDMYAKMQERAAVDGNAGEPVGE